MRQHNGSVKAFYNVCKHGENRLVWSDSGAVNGFTCSYHSWRYRLDGVLDEVQDPEDFAGGSPCGKVRLHELPCDSWGGFAWYSMDPNARPVLDYLEPIPPLLGNRGLEGMLRVVWRRIEVNTNWKFASDNFNESYHLPTVHPQMKQMIDEDYAATIFKTYPNGHNRMIELGRPSMRSQTPCEVEPIWDMILRNWGLDPAAFAGRARDAREVLQRVKREKGHAKGQYFVDRLDDGELTDYYHHTLFPNVTITGTPEDSVMHVFRTEPHITDPNKCIFEYWSLAPKIEGAEGVMTVTSMRPYEEAELERLTYGVDVVGDFVDQDLSVAVWQQKGLHSRATRTPI